MVGVPKSAGCKTCRRRRVKCDERKPHCDRCAKAGFRCEGYPSRLLWINEGPRLAQDARSAGESASPLVSSSATATLLSQTPSGPPRAMSITPLRDVILAKHLLENFQDGLEGYTYTRWISDTLHGDSNSAAHVALNALAAVFFANQNGHDPAAEQHATVLYGRALNVLNENLRDPGMCYAYSNISAVFALNVYELYASTQEFGWIQHAGGIASLMQALGPAYFVEYPAHGLFLLARSSVIVRSYRLREPCFLGEEAWATIPWRLHPDTKVRQHSMLTCIARIPGIHARCIDIDGAREDERTEALAQKIERLKHDAITLGKDIVDWRMDWEIANPACSWEIANPLSGVPTDVGGSPLFGNPLWFSARERCIEILLYNCAIAATLHFQRRYPPGTIMHALLESWPKQRCPPLTNSLLLPCNALHPLQCATEICKTIQFVLSGRRDNAGYLDLLMPLGVSMTIFSIFKGYEKQFAWLSAFLSETPQKTGVRTFQRMTTNAPSPTEFDPHITKYISPNVLNDPRAVRTIDEQHFRAVRALG